jgi:ubiquinone/menaquinone biosynthesis C-methylase UbiE
MALEIGCEHFRTKDADVFLDISKDSLCSIQGDAHYLPFRDAQFNRVYIFEVIEHLEHPSLALKEIRRVLRPKGYLVLSTPNIYQYRRLLRWFFRDRVSVNPWHISAWGDIELKQLLSKCGFRILRKMYIDREWLMPTSVFRNVIPKLARHQLAIIATKS